MDTVKAVAHRRRSVPAELVHKRNPDEVLLTGWRSTAPDALTVTAHWPAHHSFYLTGPGHLDVMLLNETIRQAFPLLSHSFFHVPLGHQLLWQHYHFEITPAALDPSSFSGEITLLVDCLETVRRNDRVTALALRITVLRHGVRLAVAETRFTIQPPAIYQRLRGGHGDPTTIDALPLTPPERSLPAQQLGRRSWNDMALTPTRSPETWRLRVDTQHPLFFDHPVDHVPGLLLLEAARQAAHHLTHPHPLTLKAMHNAFHHYIELDTPCWITAHLLPPTHPHDTHIAITMKQNNTDRFTSTLTLTPHTRP